MDFPCRRRGRRGRGGRLEGPVGRQPAEEALVPRAAPRPLPNVHLRARPKRRRERLGATLQAQQEGPVLDEMSSKASRKRKCSRASVDAQARAYTHTQRHQPGPAVGVQALLGEAVCVAGGGGGVRACVWCLGVW